MHRQTAHAIPSLQADRRSCDVHRVLSLRNRSLRRSIRSRLEKSSLQYGLFITRCCLLLKKARCSTVVQSGPTQVPWIYRQTDLIWTTLGFSVSTRYVAVTPATVLLTRLPSPS